MVDEEAVLSASPMAGAFTISISTGPLPYTFRASNTNCTICIVWAIGSGWQSAGSLGNFVG